MPAPPIVRITGGDFAGRRVRGAHGPTRPATARLRRSIFDRPDVQDALDGRVLDLYAGAGLLGVEALSRGAAWVDFVERERRACETIRENLKTLGCDDRASVHCRPVERVLPRLDSGYGLCFADPPYPVDATPVLHDLLARGILASGGLLLWRHPKSHFAPDSIVPVAQDPSGPTASLVHADQRRYGDAVLDSYVLVAAPTRTATQDSPPHASRGAAR